MASQEAADDSKLTPEQATQALADLLQQKRALKQQEDELLEAAKLIANEYGLTFRWSDEYGAWKQKYIGKGAPDWYGGADDDRYDYDRGEQGGLWVSSSMGC